MMKTEHFRAGMVEDKLDFFMGKPDVDWIENALNLGHSIVRFEQLVRIVRNEGNYFPTSNPQFSERIRKAVDPQVIFMVSEPLMTIDDSDPVAIKGGRPLAKFKWRQWHFHAYK